MTLGITLLLLVLSALFSGLNLGLMSLSPHELERKMKLGDERAAKIYPIRRRGNLLLVTLLAGNVAVIAALSIFLDSLLPAALAAILATLLITVFGEIVPQAIFARFALDLGARLAWLVRIILWVAFPVAWPLAALLDKILGDELPETYSRLELLEILEEHRQSPSSEIERDEERIARGALTFGEKKVEDVMTPRSQIVSVEATAKLTPHRLGELERSGHSRFPVTGENLDDVVGMLYLRGLVRNVAGKTAGEVAERKVRYVHEQSGLDEALNAFLRTRRHLFVVVNEFEEVVGVISIEDVLEEILAREIVGEFDRHEDLRAVARSRGSERADKIRTGS